MAPAQDQDILPSFLPSEAHNINVAHVAAILTLGYIAAFALYQWFFSPLRHIPGPKLWALTDIPQVLADWSGYGHFKNQELHKTYGRVVRTGPKSVSFLDEDVFQQLTGHRKGGRPEHGKHLPSYSTAPLNVVSAPTPAIHSHQRRVLSHGFSAKSMVEQQPLILGYVDLLIQRLKEAGKGGVVALDAVAYYNWMTFDVIGDLTFGEPFGCLNNSDYHPWVSLIFNNVKQGLFVRDAKILFPILKTLEPLLMKFGGENVDALIKHDEWTKAKVEKRLAMGDVRPDFMRSMVNKDADGNSKLSHGEILANASGLIIAGSETTATAMSAITYMLCKNPHVFEKLAAEVRCAYTSDSQIDLVSSQHLKYTHAVIEEGLRVFPPAPSQLPRQIAEGGDTICGVYLPEKTKVSSWMWSVFHSEDIFAQPLEFIPERWLGDARFEGDKRQAFQPFSAGPRNCLGKNLAYAEMRVLLARIVFNFDLELAEESKNWLDDNKVYLLYEKPPLFVHFKVRSVEA